MSLDSAVKVLITSKSLTLRALCEVPHQANGECIASKEKFAETSKGVEEISEQYFKDLVRIVCNPLLIRCMALLTIS